MRTKGLSTTIALSLLLIGVVSCSSPAPKKEKKIAMEPTANDALQPLMAKSQANLRYLIYGLLNFDQVKLERSVNNLITVSQYLPKQALSQHQKNIDEFEGVAQQQQQILEDLKQNYLDGNQEQATVYFGKLVTNCVKCHKIFRFGEKGKAKITH